MSIDPPEAIQSLYRFWDVDDRLLYIGISVRPWERWRQHRGEKPWWSEVVKVTVATFPDREAVRSAEAEAIRDERPLYNIVGRRACAPDPSVAPDVDWTIVGPHEIADMLGVSRQRVQQLAGRADFPAPVAVLTMGKIWLLDEVEAWIERRGRAEPAQSPK